METIAVLRTERTWNTLLEDTDLVDQLLDQALPQYLQKCRWFAGKSSKIKNYSIQHIMRYPLEEHLVYILILKVSFSAGYAESYLLPVSFCPDETPCDPDALIAPLTLDHESGNLIDATHLEAYRNSLFENMIAARDIKVKNGKLHFERGSKLKAPFLSDQPVTSQLLKVDQSNTSIIYNGLYFLKLYRRLFADPNPDYELSYFLTEKVGFKNTPSYAGSITWKRKDISAISLGLMQEKVENQGDAWEWMLQRVLDYFKGLEQSKIAVDDLQKVKLYRPKKVGQLPESMVQLIGADTLKQIKLLARRTAEMHIALSADKVDRAFMPEPFNGDHTAWLKNRIIYQFDARCDLIEQNLDRLDGLAAEYALSFMKQKDKIKQRILGFDELRLNSKRIRIHGDYHLGQVIRTATDFSILDFEGEPESTIRDRKVKQTPLKDVAGMLRSFHYAVYAAIFKHRSTMNKEVEQLFEAGEQYYACVSAVYLHTYIKTAMRHSLDIGYGKEISYLLRFHLLEKAIYELGYEFKSRPDWVIIPFIGVMQLLRK